jgi:hypothetical protein
MAAIGYEETFEGCCVTLSAKSIGITKLYRDTTPLLPKATFG